MPGIISVDIQGRLVRQGLENLANEVPQIGRLGVYRIALAIRTAMRVKGSKPGYPINWDSVKQKKAFFASDGFGGGIPHTRTDRYINTWQLERIGDIGYRVSNQSQGAEAIAGDVVIGRQSRIHQGRWPVFRQVVDREVQKLPAEISKEINIVTKRNGLSK